MKIQNYSSYKVLCNGGCVNPGVYSHLNDYKTIRWMVVKNLSVAC